VCEDDEHSEAIEREKEMDRTHRKETRTEKKKKL
jgi:hypothetical protein